MQVHYDAAGTCTGRTEVTYEPDWSEEDRIRALALLAWEAGFCPCGCEQRLEDAYNPRQLFKVNQIKCMARWSIETVRRQDREKVEAASPDGKVPPGWDDGLRYYVETDRVLPPGDETKTARRERIRATRRQAQEKVKDAG